jgi:hypothetical protein
MKGGIGGYPLLGMMLRIGVLSFIFSKHKTALRNTAEPNP